MPHCSRISRKLSSWLFRPSLNGVALAEGAEDREAPAEDLAADLVVRAVREAEDLEVPAADPADPAVDPAARCLPRTTITR
jgi:hypothetical protein